MKYTFKLTTPAQNDLAHIYTYITANNQRAAEKVIARIYEVLNKIESDPKIGGSVSKRFEIETDYLSFPVLPYKYIVFFRIQGQLISVGRILDSRSNYLRTLGLRQDEQSDDETEE